MMTIIFASQKEVVTRWMMIVIFALQEKALANSLDRDNIFCSTKRSSNSLADDKYVVLQEKP